MAVELTSFLYILYSLLFLFMGAQMEGSGMPVLEDACMLVACCHYVVGLVMTWQLFINKRGLALTWQLFINKRGLAPMYRRACYCSLTF